MDDLKILKELVLKGENLSKNLQPKPTVHFGSHRVINHNNEYLNELVEWKTTAIHFLNTCSIAECSVYLKEFEKEINKSDEISDCKFYKENVSSATGVLKSLLTFLEKSSIS